MAGERGNRNIRERWREGGEKEREYIVILIKSALERSRGLCRRTLSHESSLTTMTPNVDLETSDPRGTVEL